MASTMKTNAALLISQLAIILCFVSRSDSFIAPEKISVFRCCNSSSSPSSLENINITNDFVVGNDSLVIAVKPQCHPFEDRLSEVVTLQSEIDSGFLRNGYFKSGKSFFSPEEFCVVEATKNESNTKITVKVQSPNYCDDANNNCVRKCCNSLEVFDLSTYGKSKVECVPSLDNPWRPVTYHENENKNDYGYPAVYSSHPREWCSSDKVLWSRRSFRTLRKSMFRILNNGTVVSRDGFSWKVLNSSKICIDGAINFPEHSAGNHGGFVELDTIIIECDPDLLTESSTEAPTLLYGILLTISSIFLLATVIIYGLLWDKQNLHGLTLLGYATTQLFFYVSVITAWFYSYNYKDPHYVHEVDVITSFCGIIAICIHFLYISAISWLTVISFDIFAKFRNLKLTRERSKSRLKFLIYLSFTLFIPSVIVGIGVILDIVYGDDVEVNLILPRYGWRKCFLDLESAALPYLFGPIGFLLVVNCILYIVTIHQLYRLQQSTKFASANNSQVKKQRGKVKMFSKLLLLFGVTWTFEVVSYLIFGVDTGRNVAVIIGDTINIVQPILIFIIFVCKRDTMKKLCQKYSLLRRFFSSFEADDLNSSTASSRGPLMHMIWNPSSTTKWIRSRLNSTATESSNISGLSVKSLSDHSGTSPRGSSHNINQE